MLYLARLLRPEINRRLFPIRVGLAAFYAVFEQAIRPGDIIVDLASMSSPGQTLASLLVLIVVVMTHRRQARARALAAGTTSTAAAPLDQPR